MTSFYIDRYRERTEKNGNSLGESYNNSTIHYMELTFADSPTFRVLEVSSVEHCDVEEMDARVIYVERMGNLKEILFRPLSAGLNVGTYVKFDGATWLIIDNYGDKKVLSQKCNRKLNWVDKDGNLQSFDCIASAQDVASKAKQTKNEIEWNKYDVQLPLGQLFVFVELREETEKIKLNQRFIFGQKVYEVIGIDDTTMVREVNDKSYGVLQLTVKVTIIHDEDDFTSNIAHNVHEDTDENIVQDGNADTGQGGVIW